MHFHIIQSFSDDHDGSGQFLVFKIPEEHYWPNRLVFCVGWSRVGTGYLTHEEALQTVKSLADSLPGSSIVNECPGCGGGKAVRDNEGRWWTCFVCDGTGEVPFDPEPVIEDLPEMEIDYEASPNPAG